ncbi:DUF1707 domain-containing protein [Nocardiopsis sp. CNT-189]|uniref:DUF1707 SHOCT-like domain-containing protein n=1 Tax=Nocardiopsis oceanisediminis TaxID=2816862 RepID=UPI003B37E74B
MGDEPLPPERMRASDADRDAVARRLGHALQEGRLTLEEYRERLDLALGSVTAGDLAGLTRDLPDPPEEVLHPEPVRPPPDPARIRAEAWRRRLEPWRGLAAISVVLVAIWGVTSVIAQELIVFWPLVPIGFMAVFTCVGAFGRHPPRDGGGCTGHR